MPARPSRGRAPPEARGADAGAGIVQQRRARTGLAVLTLGALGVIFGDIMALVARVQRTLGPTHRAPATLVALGAVGAALFYGDSAITPAPVGALRGGGRVSRSPSPGCATSSLPLTVGTLTALFAAER